jgi:hypothetical protein
MSCCSTATTAPLVVPEPEESVTNLVQHLRTVLFHHMESLAPQTDGVSTSPPINYDAVYQMWLFFRLNNSQAISAFPDPELQEEVTYNSDSIKAYFYLYRNFYETLFLSLIQAPYQERQLLFEFLTEEGSPALMLRMEGPNAPEAYQIYLPPPQEHPQAPEFSEDSLQIVPIDEATRQELGINNVLIVSLSAQNSLPLPF